MPDTFKEIFCLLIHLSSTPHSFSISFGGQWDFKGSKEIKIRMTKTLLPKCLGDLGTDKTLPKETKLHLMWQALPPFSETCFAVLFRSVLITVCIWLSQTAAAWETLHCNWYLLAAPLWFPLAAHPIRLTAWLLLLLLHSACPLATAHA